MAASGDAALEERVGQYLARRRGAGRRRRVGTVKAEVAVPEGDIALVKLGQPATFKLNPFPTRTFGGVVTRLGARLREQGDDRFLVAEVRMDGGGEEIRPGMLGVGKISAGRRSIAYLLLRKPARYSVKGWHTAEPGRQAGCWRGAPRRRGRALVARHGRGAGPPAQGLVTAAGRMGEVTHVVKDNHPELLHFTDASGTHGAFDGTRTRRRYRRGVQQPHRGPSTSRHRSGKSNIRADMLAQSAGSATRALRSQERRQRAARQGEGFNRSAFSSSIKPDKYWTAPSATYGGSGRPVVPRVVAAV